ncbi:hypothetical protein ACQKII_02785 [Lysinibacillus sp. NPDC048646]|uniref:helix-turn-helix domain-containing protein n=1 Tax=Lysinibacillus sp. NPDC048646 TaxID=3390574 RepID=UPI003D01E142
MNIGESIKEIRIAKKIPSKVLYKDLLSRPAIARFEKGDSDTGTMKFFALLERLNITLEEFEQHLNSRENKDFFYTKEYIEAFYLKDIDKLNELANMADHDYKRNNLNIKFLHYRAIIHLLIDDIQNTKLYISEVEILQTYLGTCENWGYYEITLFSNSLNFYSNEFINIVYKRAKKTLLDFQTFKRYRNEVSLMLFNIMEKKISDGDIDGATFYLKELNELKITVIDNMYVQAMIKFFSAIVDIANDDLHKKSQIEVEKIIDFFYFLDLAFKAEQCQNLYKKVKDMNK